MAARGFCGCPGGTDQPRAALMPLCPWGLGLLQKLPGPRQVTSAASQLQAMGQQCPAWPLPPGSLWVLIQHLLAQCSKCTREGSGRTLPTDMGLGELALTCSLCCPSALPCTSPPVELSRAPSMPMPSPVCASSPVSIPTPRPCPFPYPCPVCLCQTPVCCSPTGPRARLAPGSAPAQQSHSSRQLVEMPVEPMPMSCAAATQASVAFGSHSERVQWLLTRPSLRVPQFSSL